MYSAHNIRLNFSAPRYTECGIRVGDRVLVGGLYSGSVKYVGNLDIPHPDAELYVGARLDDPVGCSDGVWYGKRFFHCTQGHGIFVPIHKVHLLMSRRTFRSKDKSYSKDEVEFGRGKKYEEGEFSKSIQKNSPTQHRELVPTVKAHNTKQIKSKNESESPAGRPRSLRNRLQKEDSELILSDEGSDEKFMTGLPEVVEQQHNNTEVEDNSSSSASAPNLPELMAESLSEKGALEPSTTLHDELPEGKIPVGTGRKGIKCSNSILPALVLTKTRGKAKIKKNNEVSPLPEMSSLLANRCRQRNGSVCKHCTTTAQQAIAQKLREEICSTYKDSSGNELSQVACISEDYLTTKLKVLLRKLYSKPMECQQSLPQIMPAVHTDGKLRHEVDPQLLTDNCQVKCKTVPYHLLPRPGRTYWKSAVSGAHLPASVTSTRYKNISNGMTFKAAMEMGRLKGSNLSKVRMVTEIEEDLELNSKMRSLLTLKEEISELHKLTECANQELRHNLCNIDSLSSITVHGLIEKFLKDLKKNVSITLKEETVSHEL